MSKSSSPTFLASHDSDTGGPAGHANVPLFRPSTTSRESSSHMPPPRAPPTRLYGEVEPDHFAGSSRRRSVSQTVSEFLQDDELAASHAEANELRRQSIIAMDRKRRLTSSTHDGGRRRTTNGSYHDRSPGSQPFRPDGPASPTRGAWPSRTDSQSQVIDLTASSPTPPAAQLPPPHPRRSSSSSSRRYIKPRWQPDAEVAECPICHRPFTFLFRRHHCRKCGRVVCQDCSPHRITIPRQFIVSPVAPTSPTQSGSVIGQQHEVIDLTVDTDQPSQSVSPSSSGGEKVRLCNPCVPDPQPDLVPMYTAGTPGGSRPQLAPHTASTSAHQQFTAGLMARIEVERDRMRRHHERDVVTPPGLHSIQDPRRRPHDRSTDLLPSHRSAEHTIMAHAGRRPSQRGVHFDRPEPASLPPEYNALSYRPTFGGSTSGPSIPRHGQHHSLDQSARLPSLFGGRPRVGSMLEDRSHESRSFDGPSSYRAPSGHQRVRLHESDVCPICRRPLPSRGPNGEETAREAHIMDCISSRDPSSRRLSRTTGQPLLHEPIRVLPFVATEKDCVSEDGTLQECSICMVEYDVGDALARLECLCKFHKECIVNWFERKQECPLHKIA